MAEDYTIVAARKQAERASKIPAAWHLSALPGPDVLNVLDVPRQCGLLKPHELDITEKYDANALAAAIAARQFSCLDVLTAFCKRAAIAQQVTNCLTEIYFDSALKRAAVLDQHLADPNAKPLGPLHGVPMSLKDVFCVAGSDCSLGMADLCGKPSTHTSTVVQILENAGAVIICKTNIPQGLNGDPTNNIWGLTLNPYDSRLIAGGSSGGEVHTLPPSERVLDRVADALTRAGHLVIPLTPPPALREFMAITQSIFGINGSDNFLDRLAKYKELLTYHLSTTHRTADKTIAQARSAHVQRVATCAELLRLWKNVDPKTGDTINIDAILGPATKFPIPQVGTWAGIAYISEANLLDIPAGTIPVDFCTAQDLVVDNP